MNMLRYAEDRNASNKLFKQLDKDGSKSASVEEMYKFIGSNDQLWEHLALKLNISPQKAKKAATRVAMELATGLDGQEALDAEINSNQFYNFRMKYMKDPEGSREFFQRAIFEVFDKDNSGELNKQELDAFLDVLYTSGSILKGDTRSLPAKHKLRKMLFEKVDTNGDGMFSYDEIQFILEGEKAEALVSSIKRDRSKSPVGSKSPVISRSSVRSMSPLKDTMKGLVKGQDRVESDQTFKQLDKDGSKSVSVDEMHKFVASNDALWERLALKLNQPPAKAKKAVTRAAMELATGLDGQAAIDAKIYKNQFHKFQMKYIKDPAGLQEFYHRAVFEIFDKDNNGFLDENELDPFLDALYEDASMFKGNIQELPPKVELRNLFFKRLDKDGDRKFTYQEVKSFIAGNAAKVIAKELEKANKGDDSEAKKAFKKMDKDGSKSASVEEMFQFVAKNDELWDRLAKQTNQHPKACKKAGTRAAMELATGLDGQAALDAKLSKEDFVKFHKRYIQSPSGSQEFFYRAVFEIFDKDNNGVLDEKELNLFLYVLYEDSSMFKGNIQKLPPRHKLMEVMFDKLDKDGDRKFSYEEIKSVITGDAVNEIGGAIHKAVAETVKEEYAMRKVNSNLSLREMQSMREKEENMRKTSSNMSLREMQRMREKEERNTKGLANAEFPMRNTKSDSRKMQRKQKKEERVRSEAEEIAQSSKIEESQMGASYREFKARLDAKEKARKEEEEKNAMESKSDAKKEGNELCVIWEWVESLVTPLLSSL